MAERRDFKKDREVFTALVISLGVILVQDQEERLLLDLSKFPDADIGRGLLSNALLHLRGNREMVDGMCQAALANSIQVLNRYFAPKGT